MVSLIKSWAFLLAVLVSLVLPVGVAQAEEAAEPALSSDAAILIDAATGRVIYEKNADARRFPASMTKMMTAILTLENNSLDEVVTFSERAAYTEYSALGAYPGERFKVKDLVTGMLLVSDNGAAVALGEKCAGSVEAFAELMNEKAQALGMENSHFVNPNGLTAAGHYSSPRDMAKLARYAMQNKDFRAIVGKAEATVYWSEPAGKNYFAENTNELLGVYPGMTGIKTGWTSAAGGCLAASAKRDGVELIAVVMHTPDEEARFTEAAKLLDYGFAKVEAGTLLKKEEFQEVAWVKGSDAGRADLALPEDIEVPLLGGEDMSRYKVVYDYQNVLEAPMKAGETVGKVRIFYDGKEAFSEDIILGQDINSGSSFLSFLVGALEPLFLHLG